MTAGGARSLRQVSVFLFVQTILFTLDEAILASVARNDQEVDVARDGDQEDDAPERPPTADGSGGESQVHVLSNCNYPRTRRTSYKMHPSFSQDTVWLNI